MASITIRNLLLYTTNENWEVSGLVPSIVFFLPHANIYTSNCFLSGCKS